MLETKRQRVIAVGAGALVGLTLMGGAAFAQTPGGSTPTPTTPQATATAAPTQPAPDAQKDDAHRDGKDCPHDQNGESTSSTGSTSGVGRGRGPQA